MTCAIRFSAVRNSAEYLRMADGLDGPQTKAVTRILNGTDRIAGMIGDLLDFTRTRMGTRLPIVRARADFGEVCRQAVDELKAFHPELNLRLDCSGDLCGEWDARRVGQAVSNLVANAIQHGDPEKPIDVKAEGQSELVILHVHNKGPSIAFDELGTIFEPMVTKDDIARGQGASGMGLGLYIVRQIAVAHDGTVEVDSGVGGTTFTARLPRAARHSTASVARKSGPFRPRRDRACGARISEIISRSPACSPGSSKHMQAVRKVRQGKRRRAR